LLISPNSEGNLKESATKSKLVVPINTADDDRGHMSDVSSSYRQITP
jgi:hypothetical protein